MLRMSVKLTRVTRVVLPNNLLERLRSEDIPAASWLPILSDYWVILDPKSKDDKVKVTNLKNLPKFKFFNFETSITHDTRMKLLDKMCKYEMDPTSIVEHRERTRFCPQTDRRADGRTDGRTDGQSETSVPPIQLRWKGGL